MTACAYLHVESYSNSRPQARARNGHVIAGSSRKWSVNDVLNEADRISSASKHIAEPLPPIWIVGSAKDVVEAGKTWLKETRHSSGRRVQRNSPWLASYVVSLPRSRAADWRKYSVAAVAFLRYKFRDRLRAVVEHLDEEHPHIHAFVVPNPGELFGCAHPGFAAKDEARRSGQTSSRKMYIDAMSNFLDDFSKKVSSVFGLQRLGPRRERIARNVHMANLALGKLREERKEAEKQAEAAIVKRRADEEIAAIHVQRARSVYEGYIRKIRQASRQLSHLGNVISAAHATLKTAALRDELAHAQAAIEVAQRKVLEGTKFDGPNVHGNGGTPGSSPLQDPFRISPPSPWD